MTTGQRQISISTALAITAWIAAASLLVVMWVLDDTRAGVTALGIVAVAATLTIRQIVAHQTDELHNAFQLGQDSVTPMR